MFAGFSGTLTSISIGVVIFLQRWSDKKFSSYNLGPSGNARDYEPIMGRYLHLSEYMTGIATGSIVLIVGSSAIHGQHGHLPWFLASPLVLMGASVAYGLCFMALQVLTYEDVLHGHPHTALNYAFNEALGFSSLSCLLIGYLWLIFAVTNLA